MTPSGMSGRSLLLTKLICTYLPIDLLLVPVVRAEDVTGVAWLAWRVVVAAADGAQVVNRLAADPPAPGLVAVVVPGPDCGQPAHRDEWRDQDAAPGTGEQ